MEELIQQIYDEEFRKWGESEELKEILNENAMLKERVIKKLDYNVFLLYKDKNKDKYYLRGFEVQVSYHGVLHLLYKIYRDDYMSKKIPKHKHIFSDPYGGGKWRIDETTKTLSIFGTSETYGGIYEKEKVVEELAKPLKGILNVNNIDFNLD